MAVAFLGLAAGVASAQSTPAAIHGDGAFTIGWLASDTHSAGPYDRNNWVNSLFSAASAGWHWTDNLKSEIDFGAGTESRVFRTEQVSIGGRLTYRTIESRFSRRTLGLSQQYQFFHNVWFHPHVALGVNFTWEHQTDDPRPIYLYDQATGTSRIEPPERSGDSRTALNVSPFVAIGYKAYLTDRAFFRNDFRVAFHGGPNETVLRLGFGFDF